MKKLSIVFCMFAFWVVPMAATEASPPQALIFKVATKVACAERGLRCTVLDISRSELGNQLAYYRALIKVDSGDFDVIAISRVVREVHPGVPFTASGTYFYLHGSNGSFYQALVAPHGDKGLAVYLGGHKIDVWGIDLRNVQISGNTTLLPNAHDWGFDLQIKDVRLATRIARYVRGLTGQGLGRLVLSGHSAGGALAYAVANAEAVLPVLNRDIAALIPMDIVYQLPPSATGQIQFSCNVAGGYKSMNESGFYFFNNLGSISLGKLAQTDPNGISTYSSPSTNVQAVLENAARLGFWPVYPFHAWAVIRDGSGVAVDGRYTEIADIVQNSINSPAFQIPNAMIADMFAASCPTLNSPYVGNLDKVKVPVFYVGMAGGFGKVGEYTLSALGSEDKKAVTIQLQPDDDAANDFGHMEAFRARDAQKLVWEPIVQWIAQHPIH